MNLAVKYLSSVMYYLRQKRVLQLEKEFSTRQWWSTEDLCRFGDERARSLASHAAKNVPYYRELFDSLNIDPTSMTLAEDWKRLPILEKNTLRAKYNDLISESEHSRRARPNHSGGSTGKPVSFLTDLRLYEVMAANMRLIFSWAGWKPGEMVLHLWGGGDKKLPLPFWEHIKALLNGYLVLPVYSYDENIFMRWWEVLKKYHPRIIYAYPSVMADFSKWLEERGYQPEGVKGFFARRKFFSQTIVKLSKVFSIAKCTINMAAERPRLLHVECPEGNMHIFTDLNRVEFLNQREEEVLKKIVVTPLGNYSQPLLRYDLEDLGFPKPGRCPCGRGYPLMDLMIGRNRDCLSTSDGRRIYPGFVTRFLDGEDWVRSFQFRQRKLNLIELSLEVSDSLNSKELVNRLGLKLQPKIKDMMGCDVNLNIKLVNSIERTAAGKHRFVINEELEENK